VTVADDSEAQRQYVAGACDAYTTDASGLAASRATMADAENHIILPEIISKEPLGPVVRHGDNNWGDVVRWTYTRCWRRRAWHHQGQRGRSRRKHREPGNQASAWRFEGDMGAMLGLTE
jgi:general L-amino acid transport system substrate-binding protein